MKKKSAWQLQHGLSLARRLVCLVPFTDEEWHLWDENSEEQYVIPLIKKYLRTPEMKATMDLLDISIEDMLNGRVEGSAKQDYVQLVFTQWNEKLGYKHFGY